MQEISKEIYLNIKKELYQYNRYTELIYPFKGGKFIRGNITYSISKSYDLACIPEYLHTSSIVIDDLPCMDADVIRRGRPSMYIKYGEAVARLTSYNLILIAMRKVQEYSPEISECSKKIIQDQFSLGLLNLINGQYNDLFLHKKIETFAPRVQKLKVLNMIEEKTGELFGIAFLLGYLAISKTMKNWLQVKLAGIAFGVCYQILDDIDDIKIDATKKEVLNIFKIYTHNEVIELFSDKIDLFRSLSIATGIHNDYTEGLYISYIESFKQKIKLN